MLWQVKKTNKEFVDYLAGAASISPALAQVFINRGLKTPDEIEAFMSMGLPEMGDPLAMNGISEALAIIEQARQDKTRLMVHGDYDADGITSTTIMVSALRAIGLDVVYFIPTRFEHGYGFNLPGVERAKEYGAGIILTVDCGMSSFEAIAVAKDAGISVIITDHHEPTLDEQGGMIIPPADAVVNPKVCSPDISMLSGAGIAFKFMQAISDKYPDTINPTEYLDLAALGTLADSVPLTGDNRAIVKEGMPLIKKGARPGIAALKKVSGINGDSLSPGRVLFTLVPRMNAAGRIADASVVVELMLAHEIDEAMPVADELNNMNLERQKIEEGVFNEAMKMAEEKSDHPAMVLWGEGWHEGVLGIVASRVVDRFGKPAFVMSLIDGVAKGSARSVPQFDIYAGLMGCSDYLNAFGGHKQAAGLAMDADKLKQFDDKICEVVTETATDLDPVLNLDATVALKEVNFAMIEQLSRLEPFGYDNPEPIFGCRELELVASRLVGRNHLKMTLRSGSKTVDAIGYGMGGRLDEMQDTLAIDAAFAANINEWGGRRSIQLNLKAIRPSE